MEQHLIVLKKKTHKIMRNREICDKLAIYNIHVCVKEQLITITDLVF